MQVISFDNKGKKKTAAIKLADEIFGIEPNEEILSQYVFVYLSNQRKATAKTKDRSEVSGGGRKPWRQKGTGRARFGSSRNPIWTGGGVAFGPTGEQNYKKRMSKKMKKLALKVALSLKAKNEKLLVTDIPEVSTTAEASKFIGKLPVDRKALIVQENEGELHKFFGNLENVEVTRLGELNPYQILVSDTLILTEPVVAKIDEIWNK